jgi:hypothetical protein
MKTISYLMLLALFSFWGCTPKNEIDKSYVYLKKHVQSPKNYVISKFKDYDYVFLGEYHRIKQDIDFVASLIPDLYKVGVRNLAYEWQHTSQAVVDDVLTADDWNEQLLYHNLSSGFGIFWGYKEYLSIFRKAWEFNQTLESNQPKFRIVLVSPDWNPCREDDPPFGPDVNHPDDVFAEIFEIEVIAKNEKALIFCGKHHERIKNADAASAVFNCNCFRHAGAGTVAGAISWQKKPHHGIVPRPGADERRRTPCMRR